MKLLEVARMGLLSFVLGCFSGTGPYNKKDGSWFWKKDRMGVDAKEPLTYLSEDFATATGSAYFRGDRITNSDGATFQVLNEWLTKDKDRVYYSDTYRKDTEAWLIKRGRTAEIAGADVSTFQALKSRYARDAKRIYWEGQPISIHDPASFEVLESSYARDRTTGYYLQVPVLGSDGATFASVSDFYAKDATHAWYSGAPDSSEKYRGVITNTILADALPASFVSVDIYYAKDAAHVWYKTSLLKGVDPATFETFGSYAKDATHVIYEGRILKDGDGASFVWLGAERTPTADAKDARGEFLDGKRVK
ncbi:MAG: DKNYY domain-containing protein [Gemmatimonas sp.]